MRSHDNVDWYMFVVIAIDRLIDRLRKNKTVVVVTIVVVVDVVVVVAITGTLW